MSRPRGNVRALACTVLERALSSLTPVDPLLRHYGRHLEERDRRLLHHLVFGVLRWLRRLDDIVSSAASRPLHKIDRQLHCPLRVAVYQLIFLERVPAHAVVSEAVDLARRTTHAGGAGFVNAVLRRVAAAPSLEAWPVDADDPIRRLGIETSHPDFLVERWRRQFGERQTELLATANNRLKPFQLLAFEDRGGRRDLLTSLAAEGLSCELSGVSPLGLVVREGNPLQTEAFRRGDCYLQDEASQAAALVPPPRAGESVLDAAASPGGKCFSLLATGVDPRLLCCDLGLSRLEPLRDNLRRLRRRLPVLVMDARAPAIAASFQRVVVDLPCSGTGTLRKHPELKWRISRRELDRLSGEALTLLQGVAELVAPGGILCAITCSLEDTENEVVGESFLRQNRNFSSRDLEDELHPPLREFVRGPGLWRILTGGDHDGFTVQVFRRSAGPGRAPLDRSGR